MKIHVPKIICSLLFAAAAVAHGGSVPALDVTVADPAGKVAFKGKTAANGTFATGKLQPGNYVVQFNSNNAATKGAQYAIVVSAGKKKVSADAVAGDKFGKGGVAMKVEVGEGLNIAGQVVAAQQGVASSGNAKTKMVNGKKYVWVGPETGSNMGGHWVEEGVANRQSSNLSKGDSSGLRNMQDHATSGSGPGR